MVTLNIPRNHKSSVAVPRTRRRLHNPACLSSPLPPVSTGEQRSTYENQFCQLKAALKIDITFYHFFVDEQSIKVVKFRAACIPLTV
jgi:hypothetical protein